MDCCLGWNSRWSSSNSCQVRCCRPYWHWFWDTFSSDKTTMVHSDQELPLSIRCKLSRLFLFMDGPCNGCYFAFINWDQDTSIGKWCPISSGASTGMIPDSSRYRPGSHSPANGHTLAFVPMSFTFTVSTCARLLAINYHGSHRLTFCMLQAIHVLL